MNVANLELCRELYTLIGWCETDCLYTRVDADFEPQHTVSYYLHISKSKDLICPAYDLGYLLRKLPDKMVNPEHNFVYRLSVKKIDEQWFFEYSNHAWWRDNKHRFTKAGYSADDESLAYGILPITANTPEDAAAKLAIELFKQRILKREVSA